MSKLVKIASIIVILACLGSLYLVFKLDNMKKDHLAKIASLESNLASTKSKLADTEKTLAQTKTDLKATEDKLADATKELQETKVALADKTKQAEDLNTKIADLTKQLEDGKTALASAKEEVQKVKDALKELGFENIQDIGEVKKKVIALGEENKVLNDQLGKLRAENKQLLAKVEELSTTPVGLRGKVLVAQDSWGFLVLSVGRDQRVQPKTQFLVYRDSKMIGKVQVVSVDATTAIAELMPEFTQGKPMAGDLVVH